MISEVEKIYASPLHTPLFLKTTHPTYQIALDHIPRKSRSVNFRRRYWLLFQNSQFKKHTGPRSHAHSRADWSLYRHRLRMYITAMMWIVLRRIPSVGHFGKYTGVLIIIVCCCCCCCCKTQKYIGFIAGHLSRIPLIFFFMHRTSVSFCT